MTVIPNLGTNEPYVLRAQAEEFRKLAKQCHRNKLECVPFGAVNVTPRTLELWAADCERRANLLEGGRKPKR